MLYPNNSGFLEKDSHEMCRVQEKKTWATGTLSLKVLCTTLFITKRIFLSVNLLFGSWKEIISKQAEAAGMRLLEIGELGKITQLVISGTCQLFLVQQYRLPNICNLEIL